MKNIITSTLSIFVLMLATGKAYAQTEKKTGASNKVSNANAQADIQQGKKIQQQSLSKPFEKIADTTTLPKKKTRKTKHKQA